MEKKYSKLGFNMIWMLMGNFATKFLLFFLVPFYTSYMSTSEFGTADLISTAVGLVTPIFSVLISESILRFTLDSSLEKKQILTISIWVIVFGFFCLVLFSPLLCLSDAMSPYILEFVLYYFFGTLCLTLQQYTKGLEHIKVFTISSIINTMSNVLFAILFLCFCDFGVKGYLYSIILGYFVTIIYIVFREHVWVNLIHFKIIDRVLARRIIRYSVPLVPNSLSWWVNNSLDKFIVTYFCGTSVNGVYAIAYKIPSFMNAISSVFTSAWQISAVENFGSKESRDFFSDIYIKYSSLYIIVTSVLLFFMQPLAKILFSDEFYHAWKYACILIIASMFQALCGFVGTVYTTAMKTTKIFLTTFIGALINTIFNFLLIPLMGALGAALATLIGYFSVWIIRMTDSKKILEIKGEFFKDCCCYFLLIGQCASMYFIEKGSSLINFILLVIVIFLNRRFCKDIGLIIKAKIIK